MEQLSPTLLKALELLLEERQVTRAAVRMGVTQSAMSKMLSKLRELLGDELLVRVGNRMEPTQRAEEILPRLSVIHGELAAIMEAAPFDPATCQRVFSLGLSDYVAQFVLPETLCAIQGEAPGMTLRLISQDAATLVEDLMENRIQIASAMDVEGEMPPGLVCRWLAEDRFTCVVAKGHPFKGTPDLNGYLAHPHVVVTGGSDKATPMERALAELGRKRSVPLETSLYGTAMEVVTQSRSILTVPSHIARHLAVRYGAEVAPLPFDVPSFRYGLIWHERFKRDSAHIWLRNQLVEQLTVSDFSK